MFQLCQEEWVWLVAYISSPLATLGRELRLPHGFISSNSPWVVGVTTLVLFSITITSFTPYPFPTITDFSSLPKPLIHPHSLFASPLTDLIGCGWFAIVSPFPHGFVAFLSVLSCQSFDAKLPCCSHTSFLTLLMHGLPPSPLVQFILGC